MKNLVKVTTNLKDELVAITSTDNDLFDPRYPSKLESHVLSSDIGKSILLAPSFPFEVFEDLRNSDAFDDATRARLNNVSQILLIAYTKRSASGSHENGGEQDESDPPAEEIESDGEGDDVQGSTGALLKEKLKAHTFGPEVAAMYGKMLETRPTVLVIHTTTVIIKDKTTTAWETTKENIKSVLNAMGFEGIFLALDYAAERSKLVKFGLKCIGSAIVPVFLAYMFISTAFRIMQNPFKHIANWLAKEFDFKTNDTETVPE